MPEFTSKDKSKRTPRQLAKQRYRVAQKVKKELSRIKNVNSDLCGIPEKTAKRVLTDQMVADIFRLSVTMLKILDFSPIEMDSMRRLSISASKPMSSKDPRIQKFEVERRSITSQDWARYLLLEEYIKNLQKFKHQPLHEGDLAESSFSGSGFELKKGYELFLKWTEEPND